MAAPLTDAALRSLPLQDYAALRAALRTGDLLFAAGEYPFSRLIRRFTGSPWSHVGLVFRLPEIDRILLLESVEDMGVRFAPLSKYLKSYFRGRPYRGALVLARVEGSEALASELGHFGIDQLTRPYDWYETVRIMGRLLFGRARRIRDRAYLCSELVYECYLHAGLKLNTNPRGFVSPQDLWADPRVKLIARIK